MNTIRGEILKNDFNSFLSETNTFDCSLLDSIKILGSASRQRAKPKPKPKTNDDTTTPKNKPLNSLDDAELQSDEDESDEREIYLCFFYQSNKLACSYYNANTKTLHTLCDIQESNKYELTDLIIKEVEPTLIITTSKADEKYMKFLKMKCEYKIETEEKFDFDENETDSSSYEYKQDFSRFELNQEDEYVKNKDNERDKPITFILMATNEFNYELSKARILRLDKLQSMPFDMSESERIIYFNSLFNFEAKLMVKSVGALLKYLDRNRVNFEFELEESQTPVFAVEPIRFDNLLMIDLNSLRSLGIFKNIDLACAYKQYSYEESDSFRTHLNEKTANTLYALYLSQLQTKVGIGKLRSYLMKPIRDAKVLNERHKVI